tara:strand:+ start:68 stop:433 length:366 start_codon:yes stop_codon:yes gene_type:complete
MKKVLLLIIMSMAIISCEDKIENKIRFKLGGKTMFVEGVGKVEYDLAYKFEKSFTLEEIKGFEQARENLGIAKKWSKLDWEKESQMYDRYRVFLSYEHPLTGEVVLLKKKYNQITIRRINN